MRDGRDIEIERLRAEVAALRAENARLREPESPPSPVEPTDSGHSRSTRAKIALFRSRFSGRTDIYPLRWHNATGRSGYAPACSNEWIIGVCRKPAVKCSACPNSAFKGVTDALILEHLQGKIVAGVYPLLPDDTCRFLAVDFDDADWKADALAYAHTARTAGVPVALEISRSGRGAHAWTFFSAPVTAADARQLGSALLTATCREHRLLRLASYDRLFPNQDFLPAGGFGNLIALPYQAEPRERGCTVFVDDNWRPFPDQWDFLESIQPLAPELLSNALGNLRACGPDIDALLPSDEEVETPWVRPARERKIRGVAPTRLRVTQAQQLYIDKAELSPQWVHRLVRLAAFQNPAFYQAQAMRRSVWNTPRLIGCAENHPRHIALPRGLLGEVLALTEDNEVPLDLTDARAPGSAIDVTFRGELSEGQVAALSALLAHETGLLWAPTGFGKTVVATALIAKRKVSTLVLVHRKELLDQWRDRIAAFLGIPIADVGTLASGSDRLSGALDVALLQSIGRRLDDGRLSSYGQVIVDECHHVPAVSFEKVLKEIPARFALGLTATPIRRDGQHPIMQMQLGPVRHRATHNFGAVRRPEVRLSSLETNVALRPDAVFSDVLTALSLSADRNERLVKDVRSLLALGRHVLLLTERIDHLGELQRRLAASNIALFCLHGRMGAKSRAATLAACKALPAATPFVLLATGKLIGEGFDDSRLDALVLALPFSWKGTLQQYVGRLYRSAPDKLRPLVLDYIDLGVPVFERMGSKRRAGYRAVGATLVEDGKQGDLLTG